MNIPLINTTISPPLVTDSLVVFNTKAFEAWLALSALAPEINATVGGINDFVSTTAEDASIATEQAALAAARAITAGEQATLSTNRAAAALTSQNAAAGSATTAAGSAGTAVTQAGLASGSATLAGSRATMATDQAALAVANAAAALSSQQTSGGNATSAMGSATTAATQATLAAEQATLAGTRAATTVAQVTLATEQATLATNRAAAALTSQNAAAGSATTAATGATTATTAAELAAKWASQLSTPVVDGLYSARYWAMQTAASVTGQLVYRGSWSAAVNTYPPTPQTGDYYKVSVSGTTSGVSYKVNDSIIYNGSGWDKIDSTDEVSSVAGKVGAVVLDSADVGLGNVNNTTDVSKPVSTAQAQADAAVLNAAAADATAKANARQAVLVSGTSIKTVNGESVLGDGDILIQAGTAVTLLGDLSPFVTQTTTLAITNFDSATTYGVSATGGTVSLSGSNITYVAGSVAGTYALDITAGDAARSLVLAVQAASVATPTITSPSSAATGVGQTPTLTTTAFASIGLSDTHAATDWELWTGANRSGSLVWSSSNNATDKLSITVSGNLLTVSTAYYPAVRHRGATLGYSAWASSSFTTAATFNSYIATPAATPASFGTSFEGGYYTGLIWNELVQSTSSTAIGTGSKTFTVADMATAPLVYAGQALEVRSRANPSSKMIGVVTGALGTTLTLNITSVSGGGTFTDWSIMARYRVIVAPKSTGENTSISYKNANTQGPVACQTLTEGRKATLAMTAADSATVYPAAHWCNSLSIAGRTDWYLPARDELELCWRNLKPTTTANDTSARPTAQTFDYKNQGSYGDTAATHGTNNNSSPTGATYTSGNPAQTAVAAFQTGGNEAFAFGSFGYWSASEYSATNAWGQNWASSLPGGQSNGGKTSSVYVRAVRRSII